MKLFTNKTKAGQNYLEELNKEHKITLDYGNSRYKYNVHLKELEKVSEKGKEYIYNGGKKTPYYLMSFRLPESKILKDAMVVYNSLQEKYVIWGWDEDERIVMFEFVSEESIKRLIKERTNGA